MQVTFDPVVISPTIAPENLWAHQREHSTYHALDPARILLWDPRVGKTREIMAEIAHWFNIGQINRVLVVAPQTVCGTVWEPESRLCFPYYEIPAIKGTRSVKTVPLYSGTLNARRRVLKQLTFNKDKHEPTIVIANRDAIHQLREDLITWAPEALVLDELHDYKTPSSLRHRAASRLARPARFTRGLTGTPTPKHYGDLYGQWKIVAPSIFGTSQDIFRERYLVCDPRFPSRVIGYRNVEELRTKAFSIADVKKRADCFDIPTLQEVTRKVALPPKAKNLYKKIVDQHVHELGNGKLLALDHTLSRLTVLQQLAGGYNPMDKEWLHDALLDTCEEEVDDILEAGKRVVIFHRFIAEGQRLSERFKGRAAWLHGGTESDERTIHIQDFNKPPDEEGEPGYPAILIIQEAVGSVGISLAGADYCIFYSCGLSYATHVQARDRIFKPAGKLTYIYLQARGTVHTWVRNLIKNKQQASEALLKPGTDYRTIAIGDD